jgi:DeoR/GlpR family transcriptional regulator of sugar metabolism
VVAEFGDGCLLNYSKLVELLSEKHGVSARTAKRAIARAAGDRKIKRTSSGFYELSSQTGDK